MLKHNLQGTHGKRNLLGRRRRQAKILVELEDLKLLARRQLPQTGFDLRPVAYDDDCQPIRV